MKITAYIRSLPTWTIVLSLFLNVLVIGTVFGALAFHHQASHHMLAKIQRAQNVLSPEGKKYYKTYYRPNSAILSWQKTPN